jgi:hypothetical protein
MLGRITKHLLSISTLKGKRRRPRRRRRRPKKRQRRRSARGRSSFVGVFCIGKI